MDTTTTTPAISLEVRRTIAAAPERVFQAWTEASALSRWFAPSTEFTVIVHEADVRVGGRYRIEMRHNTGRQHIAFGTYREIVSPRRLVLTWNWEGETDRPETVVTVELQPAGGGSELVLTHRGFTTEKDRDDHNTGWTGCMTMLATKV